MGCIFGWRCLPQYWVRPKRGSSEKWFLIASIGVIQTVAGAKRDDWFHAHILEYNELWAGIDIYAIYQVWDKVHQ